MMKNENEAETRNQPQKLIIAEQHGLRPQFDLRRLDHHMNPWERTSPTRQAVANALREIFPDLLVTVGGHHVAMHGLTGDRILMITGTSPDFS